MISTIMLGVVFPLLLVTGLGLICYTAYEFGKAMREQEEKEKDSE